MVVLVEMWDRLDFFPLPIGLNKLTWPFRTRAFICLAASESTRPVGGRFQVEVTRHEGAGPGRRAVKVFMGSNLLIEVEVRC